MKDTSHDPPIARTDGGSTPRAGDGSSLLWFLVAFGFLAAGLVGGTIVFAWRPDWMWPFPTVGFVGYIFAFRRGMLLWDPEIDRTWRQYLWLGSDTVSEYGRAAADGAEDPSGAARRPRPKLRAVR